MYEQIASNKRRSWLLIIIFIAVVVLIGYIFGEATFFGPAGVAIAVVIAVAMSFSSYYYSDRIVLSISKARPVEKSEYPHLYNSIEGLSIAAGIPVPKMYVIDDSAPNAFATGRDPKHGAIAVTTGLIEKMDRLELEGVIAHEMSHIKNYDIRMASMTVVLVGIVALLSDWMLRSFFWGGGRRRGGGRGNQGVLFIIVGLAMAILAPIIAQAIRLAVSRQREYLADSSGAMLTRYPPGLASALKKLGDDEEPLAVANKATAHMYIINPLLEHKSKINNLFKTHPPLYDRIKRLDALSLEETTEK